MHVSGEPSVPARIALRPDARVEAGRGRLTHDATIQLELTALALLDGACHATVGEEASRVAAPALVLANPAVALEIVTAEGTEVAWVAVSLAPAAVDRAASRLGFDESGEVVFPRAFARLDGATALSARRLAAEMESPLAGRNDALDLATDLLAIDLLRAHAFVDRSMRLERSRAGLVDRRLRRAVEFMRDNYDRELGTGEIAAAAYMSEFHFARLFKRLTGETPHGYLASLRVAAAKRLLAETDLAIGDIGGRVGYQSPSHFAKVFRGATGLTPTAYRDALLR